jgi:hypothetical protein
MTKGANAQFSSRAAWSAVKLGKPARSAMPCSPSVFSQGATALGGARGRAWQRLPCAWVTANSFRSDKGQRGAPNRKAVTLNSPGSGRAPWESRGRDHIYPEGVVQATARAALCNRFAVETRLDAGSQGALRDAGLLPATASRQIPGPRAGSWGVLRDPGLWDQSPSREEPRCNPRAEHHGRSQGRAASDTDSHFSCGICSITQKKKSVNGCSTPNRLSLDATCPR